MKLITGYIDKQTDSHVKSSNSPHPKCVSLDCGRRQDCVENTTQSWGERAESAVTCDPDSMIFLSVILKGWSGNKFLQKEAQLILLG